MQAREGRAGTADVEGWVTRVVCGGFVKPFVDDPSGTVEYAEPFIYPAKTGLGKLAK